MTKKIKSLLSIAGSDPMGGAGIQADIRAGNAMGFHVVTGVTAITVQNSKGIFNVTPIETHILKAQLDKILEDCHPDAIKIGMIGNVSNFIEVGNFLSNVHAEIPVVIDPVLSVSADGGPLFTGSSRGEIAILYKKYIFPHSTVATPNNSELKALLNKKRINFEDYKEILKACDINNLIVKGGDQLNKVINDNLITYQGVTTFSHPKVKCKNLHGTGCTYSTLLACYLALGNNMYEAYMSTNKKMMEIINNSCQYNLGTSNNGPLNINKYNI
ncbi:MAG: hydroxymethylpyrimidine/phosphomethylpyrimidine kinase [Muribaculaceae bacterium]|nr:hydroxymethylpyrimidine/phosphomethylpyrimidine kinase [Muribaculaceae bacterium]